MISDGAGHARFLQYLYNAIAPYLRHYGGETVFDADNMRVIIRSADEVNRVAQRLIAEIIGIGYKYEFFEKRLRVSLGKQEKKLFCAALIAADYEGDRNHTLKIMSNQNIYPIDGIFHFRLGFLKQKWEKIASYVPPSFNHFDLKRFLDFLSRESKKKIYVQDGRAFTEHFVPIRRSRLFGEEDIQTEIALSDAGSVCCLGRVDEGLCEFLKKYYAERTIFS